MTDLQKLSTLRLARAYGALSAAVKGLDGLDEWMDETGELDRDTSRAIVGLREKLGLVSLELARRDDEAKP